jgi:hypothetical protein
MYDGRTERKRIVLIAVLPDTPFAFIVVISLALYVQLLLADYFFLRCFFSVDLIGSKCARVRIYLLCRNCVCLCALMSDARCV